MSDIYMYFEEMHPAIRRVLEDMISKSERGGKTYWRWQSSAFDVEIYRDGTVHFHIGSRFPALLKDIQGHIALLQRRVEKNKSEIDEILRGYD